MKKKIAIVIAGAALVGFLAVQSFAWSGGGHGSGHGSGHGHSRGEGHANNYTDVESKAHTPFMKDMAKHG